MDQKLKQFLEWDSACKEGEKRDGGYPAEAASDEAAREGYIGYRNLSASFSLKETPGDRTEGEAAYAGFVASRRRKAFKRIFTRAAGYAAAVILAAAATWVVTDWYADGKGMLSADTANTITAPWGQRAQVSLSDGTAVWLNSGSTISYPSRFAGRRREVKVTGEAFFDVAHDSKRPFVVSTDQLDIKVLGTRFNVLAYPGGETAVSLVEGRVEVTAHGMDSDPVNMTADDRLSYSGGRMKLDHGFDHDDLLWREGLHSFRGETLQQIAQNLERYYNVQIVIRNPEVAGYRYSGKFRQKDGVSEILRILQKIHGFNIVKDEEHEIIYMD